MPEKNEESQRSLNHFAGFAFRHPYWELNPEERTHVLQELRHGLDESLSAFRVYQIYPSTHDVDFLIWTATELEDNGTTRDFMARYITSSQSHRRYLDPRMTLWGYTAPSTYSRARSAQEIDPFDDDRRTYLAIYPFVKTEEWYLLSRDARQGMMNEHIRLGKQYPDIKQLLLYSFGIQNQEFVVVYETEELPLFSKLVQELRSTDARLYTRRDTPLYTGVLQPSEDPFSLWSPA